MLMHLYIYICITVSHDYKGGVTWATVALPCSIMKDLKKYFKQTSGFIYDIKKLEL